MKRRRVGERVYRFLFHYLEAHGYPPDLVETAEGCSISLSAVMDQLHTLEIQGHIKRIPGKVCGLWLTERTPNPVSRRLS